MRGVDFDYPNTCPKIDKAIKSAKGVIEQFLERLLEDACPLLPPDVMRRLAEENAESLYSDLEDAFESVRSENESMRREADSQIRELKREMSDLESKASALEGEVDELKSEIRQMEAS